MTAQEKNLVIIYLREVWQITLKRALKLIEEHAGSHNLYLTRAKNWELSRLYVNRRNLQSEAAPVDAEVQTPRAAPGVQATLFAGF